MTDSTHPPPGLFTRSANTIARVLRARTVSPQGPASGLKILTCFINRAGKDLSRTRRAELEKAKTLLSKAQGPSKRRPTLRAGRVSKKP